MKYRNSFIYSLVFIGLMAAPLFSLAQTSVFPNLAAAPSLVLTGAGPISVSQGSKNSRNMAVSLSNETALAAASFSLSGLPSDASYSFSSASCIAVCSTYISITAGQTTPLGTYTLVVTANGGGTSTQALLPLTVISAVSGTASSITPATTSTGGGGSSQLPPAQQKFKVGDRVITTAALNVRRAASSDSKTWISTQPKGALGTVVEGPILDTLNTRVAGGPFWFWRIDFGSGADGWVVENYIEKAIGVLPPSPVPIPTPIPAPTPPPPSTPPFMGAKFSSGDQIRVSERVKVRSTPAIQDNRLGAQLVGASGVVIGGSVKSDGYTWWNINYGSGPDGWSVEDYLNKVSPAPLSPRVGPQGPVAFAKGVFSLTASWEGTPPSKLWSNPNISGVVIRTAWGSIEKSERNYDWGYIDTQIAAAKAGGKKLAIHIKAGSIKNNALPSWLLTRYPSMQRYVFYDGVTPITFAAPWDPIYLEKLTNFIKEFGLKYKDESTIAYLRLGGGQSILSGWEATSTIYDSTGVTPVSWQNAGFTSDRLIASAKTTIDAFVAALPLTPLWDEPETVQAWNDIGAASRVSISQVISSYGRTTYPNNYGVWREDLHACTSPNPPSGQSGYLDLFKILWDNPGRDGAQMVWNVQDGKLLPDGINYDLTTFRMNPKNCVGDEDSNGVFDKADILRKAIDVAVAYQMPYVEVYYADVTDPGLQEVLAYAQTKLGVVLPPPPPPPPSDTIPPTVSLTAPLNGNTVSGTIIASANATDNVGVAGVQFKLDGANLGAEDIFSPYSISWDSTTASNGSHTLSAVARDAAGNIGTATNISITVSNANPDTIPPSIPTNLTASAISQSQINLSWTASTDNVGVTGYKIYRGGVQVGTSATVAYSDTGLSPLTTYSYSVSAYDAAGNTSAQSVSVSATTLILPDTTPPLISIISPVSGQTVSSTITLQAFATDPQIASSTTSGVAGVQFKLDGANLGAEDIFSPYSISWDSTTASNGSHTLSAVARDAAGNIGTATNISITVFNANPPPLSQTLSVSISASPLFGNVPLSTSLTASVSGTALGPINYTFYCNRSDALTTITVPYDGKYNGVSQTTYTAANLCAYSNPGTYTAKVIAERGSAPPAESRVTITVSAPAPPPPLPPPPPPPPSATLTCAPSSQSVAINTPASFTAVGRSAPYSYWSALGGIPPAGSGSTFSTSYRTSGNFAVTATVGTQSAVCSVTVTALAPSAPPPPTAGGTPSSFAGRVLALGSRDALVKNLQQFLIAQGILAQDNNTGYFGLLTRAAVMSFQQRYGIPATGVMGPLTAAKIDQLRGSVPPANPNPTGATFTIPLFLGVRNSQVVNLQLFLIQRGILAAGNNTGYFGTLTEAAVRTFQCQQNIVCSGDRYTTGWGVVGAKTRGTLNTF